MKRCIYILLSIIAFNTASYSQNTSADSILKVYRQESNSRLKYKLLDTYCTKYKYKLPDTCITLVNSYFKKHPLSADNYQLMRYKGDSQWHIGAFDSAIASYTQILNYCRKANLELGISQALGDIGYIEMEQGRYPQALIHYKEALKLSEKNNDNEYIGIVGTYIAQLYDWIGDYEQSLKMYHQMRRHFEKDTVRRRYGIILLNLGALHGNQLQYDSAFFYYDIALGILTQQDEKTVASTKSNMAYIEILRGGDLKKSRRYLDEAIATYKKLNAESYMALALYYESLYFYETKEYKRSKVQMLGALKHYLNENNHSRISGIYERLSMVYQKLGLLDSALYALRMHKIYSDSTQIAKSAQNMNYQKILFETDKKELEIKSLEQKQDLQKEQLELEKTQRYGLYAGLVLTLLFGGFIYNRFKITQQQKKIIELKEKETQTQKQLVETKNHEITQSIQYAQRIQSALLPSEEFFGTAFTSSFVLFRPKDIVSGDYYWISDKEKYVFYATADCTGHGVPGGFMSMLGTALLNEIVDERKVEDCGEVLTLMREKIMQALKQAGDSESKDGMDMVLIRIDKKTLEMQYAAANNSMYIVGNKQSTISNEYCVLQTADCQLFELPCDKMPVGVYHSEVKPFKTYKQQLQKGDTIYTYTDGYADQFGGDLSTGSRVKKYTYKRLREKLLTISQEPLANQKTILENEFENWKGDNEQIDDVCLIGVKI